MSNSFEDIFTRLFKHGLNSSIYTSLPAEVISTDTYESEQTVDVKPLINKVYEDGVILALPAILAVPVVLPGAGNGVLTFPVKVGDTVLIVFSMRSLDEWLEGDGTSRTPVDVRTHYHNDAIAIPGLCTKKSHLTPSTTDVELKFLAEDKSVLSSIKMKPGGDLTVDTKKDLVATVGGSANVTATGNATISATNVNVTATTTTTITSPVINLVGNVNVTGNLGVTGTALNNGVNIGETHTHTQANDSAGDTQQDTGVPQ